MSIKCVKSDGYNYMFNDKNGSFIRWGKTKDDDPEFSPFGPEILDMEISTVCHGLGTPCAFCYKSNTGSGKNMSFDTFKIIFDKMPRNLTQIAFGIGDIDGNPDMWKMFEYCREHKVVPNLTINGWGLTPEIADKFVSLCGSVAVSMYDPKDVCYDAVKMLTDAGGKQINIHRMVAEETFDSCKELIADMKEDARLEKLHATVFLGLKQKGRGEHFNPIKYDKFKEVVDMALEDGLPIGFDSCEAKKFLDVVKDSDDYERYKLFVEPCESGVFSSYISADGIYYPCSFTEDVERGIDVVGAEDFLKDVWFNPLTVDWRERLLTTCEGNDHGCRECPVYEI